MAFDISKATEKYGPIFEVVTPESQVSVYFRLVSKKEYDIFNSLCNKDGMTPESEEYLYSSAIVYPTPQELDELIFAGESNSIVGEIAKRSGFFEIGTFTEAVNDARRDCEKLSEQIIIFIAKAMPGYKVEELENLNYQDLSRLLAISEVILGQVLDLGKAAPPKGNLLDRQKAMTESAKKAIETIRERK